MLKDRYTLRTGYGEVDQMGYVYHANYVTYCHQARTELMRKYGINDQVLEANNYMLPVISFEIKYKKPAGYDDILTIETSISQFSKVKISFDFVIKSAGNELISIAKSTVAFVDLETRIPKKAPDFVLDVLQECFQKEILCK